MNENVEGITESDIMKCPECGHGLAIDYEAAKRQVAEMIKWIRMSEVDIFDAREWSEAILDAAVKGDNDG